MRQSCLLNSLSNTPSSPNSVTCTSAQSIQTHTISKCKKESQFATAWCPCSNICSVSIFSLSLNFPHSPPMSMKTSFVTIFLYRVLLRSHRGCTSKHRTVITNPEAKKTYTIRTVKKGKALSHLGNSLSDAIFTNKRYRKTQ